MEKKDDALTIGEPIAKWERAYNVNALIVRGETIVVSDKLRSVSDEEDEDMDVVEQRVTEVRLETVAMDMNAIWPSSVEILDDGKTIIAAQVSSEGKPLVPCSLSFQLDGNILTWEIEGERLESRAAFYVGEIINKFIICAYLGHTWSQIAEYVF
jgi:hypothetical protein